MNVFRKISKFLLRGNDIPILAAPHLSEVDLEKVLQAKKFEQYLEKIKSSKHPIQELKIMNLFMFESKIVGFIDLKLIYQEEQYNKQNYVFLRGNSVCMIIFVNQKLLVIEQYRTTVQHTALEPPAGMLDESGDFVGIAAKQIEEQTGISVSRDNLEYLGVYHTSAQYSSEEMLMYRCVVELQEEKMKEIEEKIHGQETQKQRIRVKFYDYCPKLILSTKSGPFIALALAHEANPIKK